MPTALVKPWHVLLFVHSNADPMPYSASLYAPADTLAESEIFMHGYSSAAIVPAAVPGTAGAAAASTEEHAESL